MKPSLPEYPNITKFLSNLAEYKDTFLYDRLCNPNYGFWPHLEYFLANVNRFKNHESITERLALIVPLNMNPQLAWANWQKFRSAQSEVTTVFIIENYFLGQVLEFVPVSRERTPDIKVCLNNFEHTIEVKAQSGQQQGTKHPREKGLNSFSPQDEIDLTSWLFVEKISSRDGKLMKPKTIEADEQGADILIAMTDYFNSIQDINAQVSFVCPDSKFIEEKNIVVKMVAPLIAHFYKSTYPINRNLINLKEIWFFDESRLDRFVVLSSESRLLEHLKNTR